jgi:hypothetical protein
MKKLFRDVDIYRFTMIYQDLPWFISIYRNHLGCRYL